MMTQVMPSMAYQVHHDCVINTNGGRKCQLAKQKSLTLFKVIIIQRVVTQFCKTTVDYYTWTQLKPRSRLRGSRKIRPQSLNF